MHLTGVTTLLHTIYCVCVRVLSIPHRSSFFTNNLCWEKRFWRNGEGGVSLLLLPLLRACAVWLATSLVKAHRFIVHSSPVQVDCSI